MKPSLLIASPSLTDPFFERSVVLVWHHDEEGALGVVVNRPLAEAAERGVMPRSAGITIEDVLVVDDDIDLGEVGKRPVNWGGPVDTDSGTMLTLANITDEEGWRLETGVNITRSQDALVRVLAEDAPIRLCLGYAGWGPGQLDREIAEGSWLFTDPEPALVFNENAEACWKQAIQTLGIQPEWVLMSPIEA